jgi:hypothetical protein
LQAIAHGLRFVPSGEKETAYLQQLASQVKRVLERNRVLANDLREAHDWLRRVAACLRYPPHSYQDTTLVTSQRVSKEMHLLMDEFRPDFKRQPAQAALYQAWQRLWRVCGSDLLPCYDIPGLPADNLQLEGFFGRLRRRQRRISGRKTTRELCDFGQYQALFVAQSEADLLRQLQQVSPRDYRIHRRRLEKAEAPRRFLHRLHRDPLSTIHSLIERHTARRGELAAQAPGGAQEMLHTT